MMYPKLLRGDRRAEPSRRSDVSPVARPEGPRGVRLPRILGVTFDAVTFPEAVERIERMIIGQGPHYVVTANVDFLAQAHRDEELRCILNAADLVLCDGTPLVWASHLLGHPLPERVAGSDLAPRLIGLAAEKNYRLFILGAAPEAASAAVANIRAKYPHLQVDHYSPPFQPLHQMDQDFIRKKIRRARPHLLFVAFGCPKAEKWMAMNLQALNVPVMIGVGGTVDFLADRLKRAPLWMQRAGLEWIFRMVQEPLRLFPRYAFDMWFFSRALAGELWSLPWRLLKRSRRPGAVGGIP